MSAVERESLRSSGRARRHGGLSRFAWQRPADGDIRHAFVRGGGRGRSSSCQEASRCVPIPVGPAACDSAEHTALGARPMLSGRLKLHARC